jgi:peptide/nickel transport system substrate-binding protein
MIHPLALLALAACSGKPSGQAPGPAAAPASDGTRDTLVVALISDMGHMISVVQDSVDDEELSAVLSEPILDTTFDHCKLQFVPGHVTDWSFSPDGKTLSMTLRDGMKWEDGEPVTTDDFKRTFELIADPAVASPRIQFVTDLLPDMRPKVIDATHIQWGFDHAFAQDMMLGQVTSVPLLPKHKLEGADVATLRGNPLDKQPLSDGPFRLVSYEPNARIVIEPNPSFSGPPEDRAHLDRVIYRVIPEYQTRLLELQAGRVDHMRSIAVADADRLREESPNLKLYRRGPRLLDYISWNLKDPLFEDVRVRKALAMAVDTDAMMKKLLTSKTGESYGTRAVGTTTPAMCDAHNADIVPIPYDLAGAKALMAEAGWKDTNNDGILDKNGKKFEFTLGSNAGNKRRADAAVMVQANLKDLGVVVDLTSQESNAFLDNLRTHDFQASMFGWSASLFMDPSAIWKCSSPEHPADFNYPQYCNPAVDALIDKGLDTPKFDDAAPIWKEMEARIYDDQPYLFLYWMDEIVAVDSRFQDVEVNLLSSTFHLQKWQVPPDKVKYRQ